jgi:hypothetical protein
VVEKAAVEAEATDTRRNKAYASAAKQLRQAHPHEFRDLYAKACAEVGIEFVTRMSADERAARDAEVAKTKAAEKVAELVAKYGQDILDVAFTEPTF